MPKNPPTKSVEGFLAAQPKDVRGALEKLHKTIRAAAPKADEVISYQIPFYKYHGMLVGFSAAKEHCTFHIINADLLRAFAAELAPYSLGKGSIRFSAAAPLPSSLVSRIVKARVAENEHRAQKKRPV